MGKRSRILIPDTIEGIFMDSICKMCFTNLILMGKFTQTGDGDVSSELFKAEKEAKELRAQNSTLTRRGQHQREEIRRLNKVSHETCSCCRSREQKRTSLRHSSIQETRRFECLFNSGFTVSLICLNRLYRRHFRLLNLLM